MRLHDEDFPPRRTPYALRAMLAMLALIAAASAGFVALQAAMEPKRGEAPPATPRSPDFAVRDAWLIRPDSAAYAMFAEEDAKWRQRNAVPSAAIAQRERLTIASGGEWRPSPRQSLNDRVWTLVQANRLAEAIDVLTNWVERHPGDREALLNLARLLNQAGRSEEAIPRYRELLALEEGRRP